VIIESTPAAAILSDIEVFMVANQTSLCQLDFTETREGSDSVSERNRNECMPGEDVIFSGMQFLEPEREALIRPKTDTALIYTKLTQSLSLV
jgi:hypothetical protein